MVYNTLYTISYHLYTISWEALLLSLYNILCAVYRFMLYLMLHNHLTHFEVVINFFDAI